MNKVERIGSMIPGFRCPFMVNGKTKYYNVKEDSKGTYAVVFDGRKVRENEVPFGEEVEL